MNEILAKFMNVTVAQDDDSNECLYVNGKRWKYVGEVTVYACDIAGVASGKLISFDLVSVDRKDGEEWPESIADLRLMKNGGGK